MSTRLAIIVGTTRPGRKARVVADWVHGIARQRTDLEVEVVDIAEARLPHLDEPVPPSIGHYSQPHTLAWAETIARFDGFVFVTPEYNHGMPGVLKEAIDFLYAEWNNKAAGFVSYGIVGGVRAVEQLRQVMGELQVADVRTQVSLSLFSDFENMTTFAPGQQQIGHLNSMLDQIIAWSQALQPLRGN